MTDVVVPAARGPVRGAFAVPASKSIHQRALALAVLSEGESRLDLAGPPTGDALVFARALSSLAGFEVRAEGAIAGAFAAGALGRSRESRRADLVANATGFRIATALATLRPAGARTLVTGSNRLRGRPHRPLVRALSSLGAHVRRTSTGAVRVVARPMRSGAVSVAGDRSSQYATALAILAPRLAGLSISVEGDAVSMPYLALTRDALRAFGVPATFDGPTLEVAGVAPRATVFAVEPDASSAAYWWVAAALTGGSARAPGLPFDSRQPDVECLALLERMGARVSRAPSGEAVVEGPECGALVAAGDVDLSRTPDLAPLVAVLAAGASGTTRVRNAGHLRHKESDRVASVVDAVRAVGGEATALPDGFSVRGRPLKGGVVASRGDHRIALAFGVLGLAVPGVAIRGAQSAEKSYPGFFPRLERAAVE